MKTSIIITSWNTRDLLAQCLESIFAKPPSDSFDIWVVDNASTDGSAEMVRQRFPQARLIENQQNLGFACANNQAIRQSVGEYVLLLNSDTVVQPGALEVLWSFMDAHPQAGAAGPRLLNPDSSLQFSCSPAPSLLREIARLFHLPFVRPDGYYQMDGWDPKAPREVDVLLGACLLIRRTVLDDVGLFSEDYFFYSEEEDLCYRMRKASWRLFWVPQAQIVHYGGQSSRQAAVEMFLHLYQGKLLYFRKHHGRLPAGIYKLVLFFSALARLVLTPLTLLENTQHRQHHLSLAYNYRRLLAALPGM